MQAESETRQKLLDGFCAAIEEQGYAATTIADIVRHARVSKRTFYEAFADKEACFLAAYSMLAEQLLAATAAAVDVRAPWPRQLRTALDTYVTLLEARPALTRTFFLEIHAAGRRALALRRQVLQQFAQALQALVAARRPRAAPLSPRMAMALVGAVNELVLLAVEKGTPAQLGDVGETAVVLVRAVLRSPARPR